MIAAVLFLAFTSASCGPCERFKADFAGDESMQVLDVAENAEMAAEFNVRSYPTVIAISPETGREIDRTTGYRGREPMLRWMKRQP